MGLLLWSYWPGSGSSLQEFQRKFSDDYACADFLYKKRWPKGFKCPKCGGSKAWRLENRPWVFECANRLTKTVDGRDFRLPCKHQTSLIAGTIMHKTHLPLSTWFLAAFLVATHSNGMSARQLRPKLGLTSYKTAWLLLHKLRRSMAQPNSAPLSGEIEIDETFLPFKRKDEPQDGGQGASPIGKIQAIGAVELLGRFAVGRMRMERIDDLQKETLHSFVLRNTEPFSKIVTDGRAGYRGIPNRQHISKNLSKMNGIPAHIAMKWIHRIFSNFKRWGLGTYHGLQEKHFNAYCNEFAFRWNMRKGGKFNLELLLDMGQRTAPTTYRDIVGDTSQWLKQNKSKIEKLVRKFSTDEKVRKAEKISRLEEISFIDAMEIVTASMPRVIYERRKNGRRVLPIRPPEERPCRGRYIHPVRPSPEEIRAGVYRHIEPNSPITRA